MFYLNMISAYYCASAHFIEIGYLHAMVILSMRICPCPKKKLTRFDSTVLYGVLRALAIDQNPCRGLFMQTNV